jgi:uncharacterized protein DUF2505
MRNVRSTHDLACDPETFWKTFLDSEYTKKFHLEELGFTEYEILEQTDSMRKVRVVPKLNMPGPVMKLLGDRFGYVQEGTLDRNKSEFRWRMIPSTMADKLIVHGVVRIQLRDGGLCRRVDDVTLDAKVFGIGGLIESSTEKQLHDTWKKEHAFLDRWLRDR